jgi:hypothetical protein
MRNSAAALFFRALVAASRHTVRMFAGGASSFRRAAGCDLASRPTNRGAPARMASANYWQLTTKHDASRLILYDALASEAMGTPDDGCSIKGICRLDIPTG